MNYCFKEKDREMLFKHFKDLIQISYQRMIPIYSNFAGTDEISLGFLALEDFYGKNQFFEGVHYQLFGGHKEADRKVFCFMNGEQNGYVTEQDFPIQCIRISPINKKFGEALDHRDYLGTVLGLGLTRNQVGDILVEKDSVFHTSIAYVFCKEDKAEYLTTLTKVRHTMVKTEFIDMGKVTWHPDFREITGSVSSFRLDAVLSIVLKLSRAKVLPLIQGGQVFLKGRCCTENAKLLEEGDVFSVRGYGKFIFGEIGSQSKKGRYQVKIKQYI